MPGLPATAAPSGPGRSARHRAARPAASAIAASSNRVAASPSRPSRRARTVRSSGPFAQQLEQAELDASEQDLRIDEAGAEIEQRGSPAPRDQPRERKGGGEAEKSRVRAGGGRGARPAARSSLSAWAEPRGDRPIDWPPGWPAIRRRGARTPWAGTAAIGSRSPCGAAARRDRAESTAPLPRAELRAAARRPSRPSASAAFGRRMRLVLLAGLAALFRVGRAGRRCRRRPERPRPDIRRAAATARTRRLRRAHRRWSPRQTASPSSPGGNPTSDTLASHSHAWPATMPEGPPTERDTTSMRPASRSGASIAPSAKRLECQHDQRVAGQHGERLAEGLVHRGLAAPRVGVVEAGQVVMHQRGAMQELDRGRGGIGDGRKWRRRRRAPPPNKAAAAPARRLERQRTGAPRQVGVGKLDHPLWRPMSCRAFSILWLESMADPSPYCKAKLSVYCDM